MADTLVIGGTTYTGVEGIKAIDSLGNTVTYMSGGGGFSTVTINSEPTTIQGAVDAITAAIGGNPTAYIAFVPYDATYYGANNNLVCIVKGPDSNSSRVWRSDNTYDNFRMMAISSSTSCDVPVGTVFAYQVLIS